MDEVDSMTGLSPRQIEVMTENWKLPAQDLEETGVEVLMRLFTAHPEHLKYFSSFCDVPISELRVLARFRRHALNVVKALDGALAELHAKDTQKVVERFSALGVTHGGRKISEKAFQDVRDIIVDLLTEVCKLDDYAVKAWKQLFETAYKIMFAAMRTQS